MASPSISVIVPTWNEELWLPSLLGRLESQSGVGEIIIADNDSDDATVAVARGRGCLVVRGGRPGAGRNAGARAADGEVLLFVDADVGIAPANVTHIQRRFSDPSCNLVYFRLVPRTTRRAFRIPYRGLDAHARLANRFNRPGLSAPLIAVRASVFRELGGFDESIAAAEDAEFIGRVARARGGVEYATDPPLEISARRMYIEGPAYGAKSLLWAVLRLFGSRASVFGYRWSRYPDRIAAEDPIVQGGT